MAKPTDTEIEALYVEAEAAGITRDQVDEIAKPRISAFGYIAGLTSVRSNRELAAIAREVRALAAKSVDTTTGEIAPEPKATTAQVDYIANLLAERVRSGEGGGYFAIGAYLSGQGDRTRVDMDAVRALTRRQASGLIDSLKGNY